MNSFDNEIKSILNLKSNDSIGVELANRQLEVISKAYQFLTNPKNNIIYIADEVGLGKTYIAAGIAMLFRHYSKDIETHKDLIIVPKKNLQDKWKKELRNFISNNYKGENETLKLHYNFNECVKEKVFSIKDSDPITIFRMTSFSNVAAPKQTKTELYDYLLVELFDSDPFAEKILYKAWQEGFFNQKRENDLRKIVAYLMNALSPKIDCLIIDEAHNYKYGPGNEEHDESIRNITTSRFLGAFEDKNILNQFPALRSKVKFPLATKIICLSATPKDRKLMELKNQLSCFANSHVLTQAQNNEEVKALLNQFLIRGNLEYILNNIPKSRNQCREEHRLGNVNKEGKASPLIVEDNFESIFWQLLQYKSIKHLNQKNNASFEVGMLAGFETYKVDLAKKAEASKINSNEPESNTNVIKAYEQSNNKSQRESQDYNVIHNMVLSYIDNFHDLPPHPKQSKLVDEIAKQLGNQEKSLLFVRRVASSTELSARLLARYEKEVVIDTQLNFKGRYIKYKTDPVKELIQSWEENKDLENLNETFSILLSKDEIRRYIISNADINEGNFYKEGYKWLKIAFAFSNNFEFKNSVIDFTKRKLTNVSQNLKSIALIALENATNEYKLHSEKTEDIDNEEEDVQSGFYFLDYFKEGRAGFNYRQKIYRENWFDINPLLLLNTYKYIEYNTSDLSKTLANFSQSDKKKHQVFKLAADETYSFLENSGALKLNSETHFNNLPSPISESTFITRLLNEHCHVEMENWFLKKIQKGNIADLILDIKTLNYILRNVFRNGTGLLPGFVANSSPLNFEDAFIELVSNIDSPFGFVLTEIKTIINEYDLIITTNFQEKKESEINKVLRNLSPVIGTSGQDVRDRGIIAAQFRMPGFPYVLVTTDIFREGEDLHTFCQNIYHYGIAWNPSDMEQRTGRIDRINSLSYRKLNKTQELSFENMIHVFYPYLRHSVEVNQVINLLNNINKFIETFNDINIDNTFESTVNVDEEYTLENIPPQIKNRLKSIYDIHEFNVN